MEQGQNVELNYQEIDSLEREFQQILVELAGDQSLVRFKRQYERLYRALKRSRDNQIILYNKITELSRDMANQTTRLKLAIRSSQEDGQAITYLKQEMDKVFKVLELSKDREERAKQKIETLNSKIKILESNRQQFQALSTGQSNAINELKEKKELLTKDKNELNESLGKTKSELSQNYERLRSVDHQKLTIQSTLRNLQKDINEIDEKLKKDEGRKAKIQEELDNLARQKDASLGEVSKFQSEQEKLSAASKEKEVEIENAKFQSQELKSQLTMKQTEIWRLKVEYIHETSIKSQYQQRNAAIDDETESSKKEFNNAQTLTATKEKQNDKLRNELVHAKEALATTKKEYEMLMSSVPQIHREIMDRKKLSEQDQKEIEELDEERNRIQKDLIKLESQFKSYNEKLTKRERQIAVLESQIIQGNNNIEALEKAMVNIEKEKEAFGKKAAGANAKYLQSLEEIKLKGNLISEYQKKNIETENKLKEQQQLYESVRSDRNTYSKSLSETEDQIAETKRRYKIVNHQINQLKEQIQAKEVALAKEHFQHKKKDQTLLDHSRALEKKKKQMDAKKEVIKNFHNEISKLHSNIKQLESERQHKKDEYELIVAQRDILGTQLIRRNDESALLYEKIKIQQATLAKGETAFRDRIADLKLLEYKKNDLKRELKILMKDSSKIPTFKNEIYNIQSELIEEKLKVKALSEELQNPLNVHRCRSLEGTDPDVFEMKEKIKTLQKRLIFKTEQVVEKEVLTHQKEKQIEQIREIMKRQPGLNVAIELSVLQRNLTLKTRKMKQLAAQINMYQAKTNEYKYDIERTSKEIQQIRRKYNEQKKREQIKQENEKILQQA